MRALIDRFMTAWHERGAVLKAMSFGAIGVVNTVVDFAVFWIAARIIGLPLIVANVLAWLVAVSGSYLLNTNITFARESGRKLRWRDYLSFAASGIAGLIADTATLLIALRYMPLLFTDSDYQLAAAKACALVVAFVVNFSLSHFVVFRKRDG